MAKPIKNDSDDEGAAEDASDDGKEPESYRIKVGLQYPPCNRSSCFI